jgi:beta-glucosidase
MDSVLENKLGFQRFIMADWNAQHSTMSAMTGPDMTMPGDSDTS